MRRLLSTIFLIGLAVLLLIFVRWEYTQNQNNLQVSLQSPESTATPQPYPEPTIIIVTPDNGYPPPAPTSAVPTSTLAPRIYIPTPSATPTVTIIPSPVPLQSSAYDAIWVENIYDTIGRVRAVICRGNPQDIGNREKLVEFLNKEIQLAIISPTKEWIAFSVNDLGSVQRELWLVTSDGSITQQVATEESSTPIAFSHNGDYLLFADINILDISAPQTGQVKITVFDVVAELDLVNAEFINFPLETWLGWSLDDTRIYYILSTNNSHDVWSLNVSTESSQQLTTLTGELGQMIVDPQGRYMIYGYYSENG